MTSGTFKKKYSGLAGQTNFGRKFLKSNVQKTILERRLTKSKFCPAPVLKYDEGLHQDSQASCNGQLSLGDSWEESENQFPDLVVLDRGEQEIKSQKSYRTVEEISNSDDQETDSDHRQSDQGQEMKSIDETSEDKANRD
jgi:hypothetical protein